MEWGEADTLLFNDCEFVSDLAISFIYSRSKDFLSTSYVPSFPLGNRDAESKNGP